MNARISGARQRFSRARHVLFGSATECRDFHSAAARRHCSHGREVALGGDRKPGFDDVYAEFLKLFSHLHLLGEVHRTAG